MAKANSNTAMGRFSGTESRNPRTPAPVKGTIGNSPAPKSTSKAAGASKAGLGLYSGTKLGKAPKGVDNIFEGGSPQKKLGT